MTSVDTRPAPHHKGAAGEKPALGECPERQRGRTVNPLRKLRRFESYFPHQAFSKSLPDQPCFARAASMRAAAAAENPFPASPCPAAA